MLKNLSISNYAIIEELSIDFSQHLTIITGETGAGKSILVGALSLILGTRADASVQFNKEKKTVVEGCFDLQKLPHLKTWFEEEGLDFDEETIIRREILPSGKSRAFINDTPVNLNNLKFLGSTLVDLHEQMDSLEIGRTYFQLLVVDSIAEIGAQLEEYRKYYRIYRKTEEDYYNLLEKSKNATTELEYMQFQYQELEDLNLDSPDELDILEKEEKLLENAEKIQNALSEADQVIDAEQGVNEQLISIVQKLNDIKDLNPAYHALYERINSCQIELEDISRELSPLASKVEIDEDGLQELRERMDTLNRVVRKFGVNSLEELIAKRDALSDELHDIHHSDELLIELQAKLSADKEKAWKLAEGLSKKRKSVSAKIEETANQLLKEVGLPNAEIRIEIRTLVENKMNENGFDQPTFLFSANKGVVPVEIRKAASGGEMSRLMLIFKSLVAENTTLPTLIFDEIDTGISGEVARRVGGVLQNLAKKHQVISITHLPQIASKGDKHLFIYKENKEGSTFTQVRELTDEDRINELAKMLSGENPTEGARANARELLSPVH